MKIEIGLLMNKKRYIPMIPKDANIVLFGAGEIGGKMLNLLMDNEITPAYFVDNGSFSKNVEYSNGSESQEFSVRLPEALLNEDRGRLSIIITAAEPCYSEIYAQIEEMGLAESVCGDIYSKMHDFEIVRLEKGKFALPDAVRIEASTLCQLNCTTCSMRTKGYGTLGKGFLKFIDFKDFIDKHPYIRTVELSNYGEIFLNPELKYIVEYACKRDVRLTAYNGVNFNSVSEDMIEALVKYGFYVMAISIDGASQEIYSVYRRNGDYNRVIKNIEKLNMYKKMYNSALPKLMWQYVIMEHNEDDIVFAKEQAKRLDMKLAFKLTWDRNYKPRKTEMLRAETGLQLFTREDEELNSAGMDPYMPCRQLWFDPQINWDGRLLGCCRARDYDFGINVFKVGLPSAISSDNYMQAKLMLLGAGPPLLVNNNIPCIKCNCYIQGKCGFNDSHPLGQSPASLLLSPYFDHTGIDTVTIKRINK